MHISARRHSLKNRDKTKNNELISIDWNYLPVKQCIAFRNLQITFLLVLVILSYIQSNLTPRITQYIPFPSNQKEGENTKMESCQKRKGKWQQRRQNLYEKGKRQLEGKWRKYKKLFLERVIFPRQPLPSNQEILFKCIYLFSRKSFPPLAYSFIFNSFFVSYLWLPEFTGISSTSMWVLVS